MAALVLAYHQETLPTWKSDIRELGERLNIIFDKQFGIGSLWRNRIQDYDEDSEEHE